MGRSRNVLQDLIKPFALEAAKQEANRFPATELVQLLMEIEPEKRAVAFRLLEKNKAIAVFEYLRPEDQAALVQAMDSPQVMELLGSLAEDDRVRLLDELPAKVAKRLVANLDPQQRQGVDLLLGYPDGSAGRIMTVRYLAVRETATVAAVLGTVRESQLEAENLTLIFVIDSQRYYRGFVRAVQLIQANPDQIITELMAGEAVAARARDRDLQAARLLKDYDLPALPVVDDEGRLLGDITFDDVIDLIESEATAAALSQAGVGNILSRDQAWSDRLVRGPIRYAIQLRIACLIITLIGGFVVGGVIQGFEEVLESLVFVAIFIPVVMDMGGNVGTQSTTVFARGLAWQQIDVQRYWGYLFRELRIGVIMGVILGTTAGVVAYVWQGVPNGYPQLGLAVGLSLFAVVTLAAVLGAFLPWLLLRFGFDHGPAADPFITTIKDFTGLLLYFYLVQLLMGGGIGA